MTPSLLFRLLPLVLGFGAISPAAAASNEALTLRVMTFNLRFASPQPPNAWPDRRPIVRELIEREAPDVIGTQEGVYSQLRDIAADLPDYEWIGLGREGGSRGEFMAIFFRRDRFAPVAFDHFWLSDTPDVIGSMTWGNRYRRMVTWVRLRERSSGREFYVWNTHFDHEVELARQKAATLLRDRLAALEPTVPLVLVGDFNCPAGNNAAFDTLTRDTGLVDTWTAAKKRRNESLNTFHGYEPPLHDGVRIDWVLARDSAVVEEAAIVDYRKGSQYPSDHFPVTATVRFE